MQARDWLQELVFRRPSSVVSIWFAFASIRKTEYGELTTEQGAGAIRIRITITITSTSMSMSANTCEYL